MMHGNYFIRKLEEEFLKFHQNRLIVELKRFHEKFISVISVNE